MTNINLDSPLPHAKLPITLDLGIIQITASISAAFLGASGRLHVSERDAVVDKATAELAARWLRKAEVGDGSFNELMQLIERDPELIEATVRLLRFKGDK